MDYENYYRIQKEEAGEISGGWANQMIAAFRSFLETKPKDSKILDIGCAFGTGVLTLKNEGWSNITGVDLISEKIKYGLDRGANLIVGDMHNLPFDDNSFEYSFMSHSIEHSLDPVKAISEMVRVTSREGLIIVPLENTNSKPDANSPHTSPIISREAWDRILIQLSIGFITIPKMRMGQEYWSYFTKK